MKKLLLITSLIILTGGAMCELSIVSLALAETADAQRQNDESNLQTKCSNSCIQDESKVAKCNASRIIEEYINKLDLEANNKH